MEHWCSTLGSIFEAEVLPFVAGCDVFIDNGFAELLHWTETTAALLSGGGACSLREFSSFESCSARGAVFLLSSPLCGFVEDVLRDLVTDARLHRVLVLTSVSAQANALAANPLAPEDPTALFPRWAKRLSAWSGRPECRSEVRHLAFSCVPVLPRLWLAPQGVGGAHQTPSHDWTLVDVFNNLLESLKVREEIFAVGHRAVALATDLVNFTPAKQRRKNHQRRVSLLLMDRALDLVSVTSMASAEVPLDDIFRHLQPFAESVPSDVAVDLRPLSKSPNGSHIPSGCLSGDRKLLQQSSTFKQKDLLMVIYRNLLEAASEENLDVQLGRAPSKITAEMLEKTVEKFREAPNGLERHAGLLQMALALAQSLERQAAHSAATARQQRNEKALVQQGESRSEQEALLVRVLSEEAELVQQEEEPSVQRTYNFDEAVAFAIHALSLIGPNYDLSRESWQAITVSLTHLLCEELQTNSSASSLIQRLYDGRSPDVDAAPDVVLGLVERLRGFQDARTDMRSFQELVDTSVVPKYRPLIGAIASDCARRSSRRTDPTPQDYVYKSTGLKDLLRGGLSYFVSTSSPHPADNCELLLIAVLGPVAWAEYRALQEAAEKSNLQMCLICSGLGKCSSELNRILC